MLDLQFAWRSLKRNPGLTALIVVTFTLGIGVNAATFTLLDRIYLRPPTGIVDPANVHRIWLRFSRMEGGPQYAPSMTFPMYRVIKEAWGDTTRVALVTREHDYRNGGTRRKTVVPTLFATANYWNVLGLRPQLGRFYSADEDRVGGGAPVVVLSDRLWRSQFGADPSVLGKTLQLDTRRYTIVGVAQPGFAGDDPLWPTDAFIPMASLPNPAWMTRSSVFERHDQFMFQALARGTASSDLAAFDSRATRAIQTFNRAVPRNEGDTLMTVAAGPILLTRGPIRQRQEHLLSTRLSAVAVIVLVIAAANIVNLLLARATRRRREIAVRLALGLGRWRLVHMLTTETLLLAAISAVASLLAAWWGGTVLRVVLLPDTHFAEPVLSARVAGFTIAIALLAGLVAGIVPALQSSNPDLTRALKEGARDGTVHRSRLRAALVVTQAALSVVLLAGAALFVQSLKNVRGLDIGYDASQTVIGSVEFDPGAEPPRPVLGAQIAEVARRLESNPGVQAVGRAFIEPFTGFAFTQVFIGDTALKTKGPDPVLNPVTRSYFAAAGVKLLRGSVFEDAPGAPPQVVINEAFAQQIWPGVDPLGRCARFGEQPSPCYTVVGIAETARRGEIIESPVPQYYLPMNNLPQKLQNTFGNGTVLFVRAAPSRASQVVAQVRRELDRAFPSGYPNAKLLSESLEPQYRPWRVGAVLFTGFGVLALIVAIVGIYSTVSYGVSQRTHEFGVRIALGARISDVLRQVLGEGLRTVAVGVVFGIALALAAGRLVATLLYGITPGDPTVMVTVSLVLLVVAAVATLVPAWRAGRVDPITVLRSE